MAPRFSFVPARWLLPESPLSAPDRLTLSILCMWANRDSGQCYPKVSTITACAKLSERTVRQSLHNLVHHKALRIQKRYADNGSPLSNLYTVIGYDPPDPQVQEMQEGGAGGAVPQVQDSSTNVVITNTPLDVRRSGEQALSCPDCDYSVGFVPGTTRRFVQHESDCPSRQRRAS